MKESWENSVQLGEYYSEGFLHDVKKTMITLSRYKFASKMMEYRTHIKVLELGCSEGIGAYFFMQLPNCDEYVGVDIDEEKLAWANAMVKPHQERYGKKIDFIKGDIISTANCFTKKDRATAVISLDVIEHIEHSKEEKYMNTIIDNLAEDGIAIVGTPNITMKPYQDLRTQKEHINMFDAQRLYNLMNTRFRNVFIFSMNDEIVHTGFTPMSCYLYALCCNPIR
ncbi:MAG: class I SAM-dependent methyltransferase [Roseburia sp.]